MDKTFDEAIAGIRQAEYGVEVREDIAQGMEYVKQHAEEVVSRQEEAVQSARTATEAAATATEQAKIAASTVEQATASAVKSATDQADLAKSRADAAASSAAGAAASQTAAASSASAAKASEEAAAKSAADAKVIVSTDTTLTVSGAPADAKATGDALSQRYSKVEADAKFGNFYTKPEVDTLLKGVNPYPVGSIYQSTDATSPAELFGGTWEQIASERVLMGASRKHAAGATVNAGLPDITGTVGGTYYNTALIGGDNPNSGAFKDKGVYDQRSSGDYSSMEFHNVDFAASNSNAIYGRSSTVQPAAYYVHIWRRVA